MLIKYLSTIAFIMTSIIAYMNDGIGGGVCCSVYNGVCGGVCAIQQDEKLPSTPLGNSAGGKMPWETRSLDGENEGDLEGRRN